jgi:glycosyltransferase involved in cell wall biosynthesis
VNILFLSTSDSGGAGGAAYSIYRTLKKYHSCKFIVFRKSTSFNDVYEFNKINKSGYFLHCLISKLINKISFRRFTIDRKYDMMNLMEKAPFLKTKDLYSIIDEKPDLIILNWISGFINSRDINTLYKKYKSPLIWILHDYAPLTGGCHIAWDCMGFTKFCGRCPGLHSTFKKDLTNRVLLGKVKNLLNLPVFTTGWSDFILNKSRQSRLFYNRTLVPISPSIDSLQFSPSKDKLLSKKALNISSKNKVILFGAQNVFSEYKGFRHLIYALNILNKYLEKGNVFSLLTFGKTDENLSIPIDFQWEKMGNTENAELAFQASDVFVVPTLQDTGPMTVCESLMCGTPVIGYPMGIILDVIKEKETGFIVEEGNINLLAEKIAWILNLSEFDYQRISINCRNLAKERFSEEAQVHSFQEVFNSIKIAQDN